MSKSPVTNDKEQKNEAHSKPATKNDKKNDVKILYVRDTGDSSRRPIVQDGIQKEVIRQERKSQISWNKKYDYLSGNNFQRILAEEAVKAGLPEDTFVKRKKNDASITKRFRHKLAASPPIPKTSTGIVGWRSSQEEYRLEFNGPMYISPKRTTSPPPEPDALPITHQRWIFLG
ncbi:uncharacterized protein LOC124294526 [Neodiprion lecontei]|uniref:Uncharacterized protein LOC124294526 n=1 Tax=Neodiprion lecontei TaxID=441921 RepID=A0ABM3G6W5_NEOLC|nr:uncharacterized protein LOC124294526 [Neodiprion lecontei]XP_046596008.1 uncharacterized protein LOC124294526 [Neodiprion lecontei]